MKIKGLLYLLIALSVIVNCSSPERNKEKRQEADLDSASAQKRSCCNGLEQPPYDIGAWACCYRDDTAKLNALLPLMEAGKVHYNSVISSDDGFSPAFQQADQDVQDLVFKLTEAYRNHRTSFGDIPITENKRKEVGLYIRSGHLKNRNICLDNGQYVKYHMVSKAKYVLKWGYKERMEYVSQDTFSVMPGYSMIAPQWVDSNDQVLTFRAACGPSCVFLVYLPFTDGLQDTTDLAKYNAPLAFDTTNHIVAFISNNSGNVVLENVLTRKQQRISVKWCNKARFYHHCVKEAFFSKEKYHMTWAKGAWNIEESAFEAEVSKSFDINEELLQTRIP